jgi:hypothetical protein
VTVDGVGLPMTESKITFVPATTTYTLIVTHAEAGILYNSAINLPTDTTIKIPGVVKFTPTNIGTETF